MSGTTEAEGEGMKTTLRNFINTNVFCLFVFSAFFYFLDRFVHLLHLVLEENFDMHEEANGARLHYFVWRLLEY